MVLKHLNKR